MVRTDEGEQDIKRGMVAVLTLETDYPSDTDNPSSKSVKVHGKTCGSIKSGGLSIQKQDRSLFILGRIICLTLIIQRITHLRRIIRLWCEYGQSAAMSSDIKYFLRMYFPYLNI